MAKLDVLKRYLVPGLVFQTVVIAGGYGTGRELVEFFLSYGPLGGLLAMAVTTLIWSAVCAVAFEFARSQEVYDYRNFCLKLLGRFWGAFEVCYLGMMLLVLAVVAAAAGSILQETFGLGYLTGVILMMAAVGFLVFKGSSTLEKLFSYWALLLSLTYLVFCVWCFQRFGTQIIAGFASMEVRPGWLVGGSQYAGYNIGIVPAVFFCLRQLTKRKEAISAGLLAGPITIFPAFLFYLAMVGEYPAILTQTVPANYLLGLLGSRAFQYFFQIILLGTLIQTGTGLIHAFNERVAGVFTEKGTTMPSFIRPAVAVALLVVASLMAQFGLIDLIAKGYGTITWGFWLVFVIPVLTVGIWKLTR